MQSPMQPLFTGALTIERVQVTIADLPSSLAGLRIVQLSDLHFDGVRLSKQLLQAAISASNAADPDLVVLTGDLVTDDPIWIHALLPWLQGLTSRYGTFVAFGNHDGRNRQARQAIRKALTDGGITVLWNEAAYPVGPQLALVGLVDRSVKKEFNPGAALAPIDAGVPRIVLSHNPDTAELLQRWRVDLQLSGHTHGGQVNLPGLGSLPQRLAEFSDRMWLLDRYVSKQQRPFQATLRHWEWLAGLHKVGQNQLYVNRGLGTYFPGRLFCPPEVTVITLVP